MARSVLPSRPGHQEQATEMPNIPVIHTTAAELETERFWAERLAPVTAEHGLLAPTEMKRDGGDPGAHLLLAPGGQLLAIVRTDRPACPTCGR